MSRDFKIVINKKEFENISVLVKEIKENLKEIKVPSMELDPQIIESLRKIGETAKQTTQTFSESLHRAMEMNFELTTSFSYMIHRMINSIDWDGIREGLRARLEDYEQTMTKYDKDLWTVDQDLLEEFDFNEELNMSIEMMETIVDDKLHTYMGFFQKESIYSPYITILEQSYSSFKAEQYALASFPLFAVIEGIISTTFEGYEINLTLKPKLKHQKNRLYVKLTDYVESKEDELAINLLFFRRVFYVYQELFKPSWNTQPKHINRNWIMHGSYNYDSISKKDVLRLFQLVKALEIMKYISFEQADEQAN